jgi:protein SCO1/2
MYDIRKNDRKSILLGGFALVALMAGVAAGWIKEQMSTPQTPKLQAATALLEQAKPLPSFSLIDSNGKHFNNARLTGKWSFLFFGYTHCPDVCPTTLATLNKAMQTIASQGNTADAQVVFVSVDPQRDTPGKLRDYVSYFNPKFVGATGGQRTLDRLTRALGIIYTRIPDPSGGNGYLMDHSASILLIDPESQVAALFSPPYKPRWLANDFHKLRDYYQQS